MIDLEALIDLDVLTAPQDAGRPWRADCPSMRRVDPHRGGRKTAASGDFHAKNRRWWKNATMLPASVERI